MCRCRTQPNALCPRVEISAVAVVVFALAWLKKNNNNYNNSIKKRENLQTGNTGGGGLYFTG